MSARWWMRHVLRIEIDLTPQPQHSVGDALRANAAADEIVRTTQERWPEVREVAGALESLRLRNSFAEMLSASMQRQRE